MTTEGLSEPDVSVGFSWPAVSYTMPSTVCGTVCGHLKRPRSRHLAYSRDGDCDAGAQAIDLQGVF